MYGADGSQHCENSASGAAFGLHPASPAPVSAVEASLPGLLPSALWPPELEPEPEEEPDVASPGAAASPFAPNPPELLEHA
jgi:hypothetical protein